MDSIILIIVSAIIFLPYIIYQYWAKNNHIGRIMQLYQVEAGPTKKYLKQKINLMSMVDVDMKDIVIDSTLQYFIVKNQCMKIKGISDGDIIGVRMFENGDNIPKTTKKGQMLLIYIDDEHFKGYKIREQGDITDDGTSYNTYHYKGGIQNQSSKPHAITSIKGIVEEVYQRNVFVQ